MSVVILQPDNRPVRIYTTTKDLIFPRGVDNPNHIISINDGLTNGWDYLGLSYLLNQIAARTLGFRHEWLGGNPELYGRHPVWSKIALLNIALPRITENIVILMDSDAWIRDAEEFGRLVSEFSASDDLFLFSLDPDRPGNTLVNSGVVLIRNVPEARRFFQRVWSIPDEEKEYSHLKTESFFDQGVIEVLLWREDFYRRCSIRPMKTLNTPGGTIVRHCWWKAYSLAMMVDEILCLVARNLLEDPTPVPVQPDVTVGVTDGTIEPVEFMPMTVGTVDPMPTKPLLG